MINKIINNLENFTMSTKNSNYETNELNID